MRAPIARRALRQNNNALKIAARMRAVKYFSSRGKLLNYVPKITHAPKSFRSNEKMRTSKARVANRHLLEHPNAPDFARVC
jgi:hypothetical protein